MLNEMLRRAGIDVLLSPAATGEALEGLESTGDPILNRVWTLLHMPCMTLPLLTGPAGLPMGLQLIGRIGRDWRVVAAAKWIEARFPYRGTLDERIALTAAAPLPVSFDQAGLAGLARQRAGP